MKELEPFRVLLSTIDPEYPSDTSLVEIVRNDQALLKSTMKLAKDNGLYYYFLSKMNELSIGLPILRENWDNELQRLSRFLNTLKLLHNISSNYDIDYILIKACTGVTHVPRDVDIFIQSDQREKIIKLLGDKNLRLVQEGSAETSFEGKGYMRIDVYTEITYVSVNFLDNSYLWNSKTEVEIFGDRCWGLSKEADLLLTLVHDIIAHRRITLLDLLHIRFLRQEADLKACREYADDMGWGVFFGLAFQKIRSIERDIYKDGVIVKFPYQFDRRFFLRCISSIRELRLDKTRFAFLFISLLQDEIIYKSKGTMFYDILRSSDFIRHLLNSLTAFVKKMRGDKKSVGS